MNRPFVIDDGRVYITSTETLKSQIIVSGLGIGLPDDFSCREKNKADVLERRLQRLEATLGLRPLDDR